MPTSFFAIRSDQEPAAEWGYKSTTTDVIVRGDLVMNSSGSIIRMDTSTSNLAFAGVALDSSPAGENAGFRYAPPVGRNLDIEWEYGLDSQTACVKFEKLQWEARQSLTKSDTDPIMYCSHANSGSSAYTVRCKMLEQAAVRAGDAS